ncbi:hypothetical protein N9980_01245 [bacterium]|nr:hypothetical protein [bacterium]
MKRKRTPVIVSLVGGYLLLIGLLQAAAHLSAGSGVLVLTIGAFALFDS